MRTLRTVAIALAAAALLLVPPPPVASAAPSQPVIVAIAAGDSHTCAVTSGGRATCWGDNGFGQLGNGTTTRSLVPVDVSRLHSGLATITAGSDHTCALTEAGRVWCWGYGAALGTGTETRHTFPVAVAGLASGVVSISAGQMHTCALTTKGAVKCWGDSTYGQLGTGTRSDSLVPVGVVGLTSRVVAVSAGGLSTCALTSTGAVLCWGYNGRGELGDGTTTDSSVPVHVSGLASGTSAISVGDGSACALTEVGGVTCWGGGAGYSGTVPVAVPGLANGITAVSVGGGHACALTPPGGVKCWGSNGFGQLGDGTPADSTVRTLPVDVVGLSSGAASIAAGHSQTCALSGGGRMRCWGGNANGLLGNGSTSASSTPVTVDFSVYQMVVLSPSVPAGTIGRGTTVRFTATVRPRAPAGVRPVVRFVVYRQEGGVWRLDATRDVIADEHGAVSLRWGFVTPGLRYVRARALADRVYGASSWGPLASYEVR